MGLARPGAQLQCGAILLLVAASSVCFGAVYRCDAKDGSTTYSDSPCATNAQVIQIEPPTPSQAPSSANSPPLAPGQAGVNETLERIAVQCETSDYNDWYRAQNPKPNPEERIAQFKEIVQKCRATLPFQKASSNIPVNSTLSPGIPQEPSANQAAKSSIRISQIASTVAPDAAVASATSLAAKPGSTIQAVAPSTADAVTPATPGLLAGKEGTFSELIDGPLDNLAAYLLQPGSNVNERKTNSETLLDIAADRNKTSIVGYLLDHGADIEASPGRDNIYRGITALHHAAHMNSIGAAELLISRGAKVDSHQEVYGGRTPTPLCDAASQGNLQMVVMLLNHGADVEAQFGVHQSPLSEALAHGHMDVVRVLMDHGAKLRPQYLAAAAMQGRVEATKLLLTQQMDQVTKDEALRYAILGGPEHSSERKQIVQDLLDHNADIDNTKSVPDVIPVMFATTPDMVGFLFAHGANREANVSGAQLLIHA
jgi:ankyrin repeat protein